MEDFFISIFFYIIIFALLGTQHSHALPAAANSSFITSAKCELAESTAKPYQNKLSDFFYSKTKFSILNVN